MFKLVTVLVTAGLFVASTVFAQSSEKDILEAKNACRERVESFDKDAVLRWEFEERLKTPMPTGILVEMTSHWSLSLHSCLAILVYSFGERQTPAQPSKQGALADPASPSVPAAPPATVQGKPENWDTMGATEQAQWLCRNFGSPDWQPMPIEQKQAACRALERRLALASQKAPQVVSASTVFDAFERRIVATTWSVWTENKRHFFGSAYVPLKRDMTEEDYQKLITQ